MNSAASHLMNSAASLLQRLTFFERSLAALQSQPAIRRRKLRRGLQAGLLASGLPVDFIKVNHRTDAQSPWLVGVSVKGNRVALAIAPGVEQSRLFWYVLDRLPGVLYLARLAGEDFEFKVDVSDGHMDLRNVLGFCANHESVCLIPDPDFFDSRGYAELRDQPVPDWAERSKGIIWRGSPNGQGMISNATMNADDPELIQRVRMCLLLRDHAGIDARLVMSERTEDLTREDAQKLEQAGIAGQAIDQAQWWQQRFAIDIDGYTNAWSGLFTRLLMGCCVLKIASPTGHRQWYYDRLEPWQHYVPVTADLCDLVSRIEWCQAHEAECERIAQRGRELALTMDFDGEYRRAAAGLVLSPEVTVCK